MVLLLRCRVKTGEGCRLSGFCVCSGMAWWAALTSIRLFGRRAGVTSLFRMSVRCVVEGEMLMCPS